MFNWKLKQGVKWADGQPFTAADVLFTYQYITNPEVKFTSAAVYVVLSVNKKESKAREEEK